jgi:hypothetical protein
MAVVQVILAQIIFRFRINPRYLASLFVFIIMVILFNLISISLNLFWIKSFLLMVAISVLTAMGLKLLDIGNFIKIVGGSKTPV